MDIELNKTYKFDIPVFSFGNLSNEELIEVFKDGRFASPFLERQLTKWFPELTHVKGNKGHDHRDKDGILYDAKNFTKRGLKFMPSNQVGQGRTFDAKVAHGKAKGLIYIACDIVEFPSIRVRFSRGRDLINTYPDCKVPLSDREAYFND